MKKLICLIFAMTMLMSLCACSSGSSSSSSSKSSLTDVYGHDKFDAQVVAEDIVKDQLKSPSTAEFCSTNEATITLTGKTWTVRGWVDAQNGFGATIRNEYMVMFTFTSSDRYTIDLCSIK